MHDFYYKHPSGMGWLPPMNFAEVFPALMARDFEMLEEDWPARIKPATCSACRRTGSRSALTTTGNTSAASTSIMLDEDRRAGRVGAGDLVVFLWIGAGNGAMNGYAAMLL